MASTAAINAWAAMWADLMVRGLIDASVVLLLVGSAWLLFRRRMSAQLACGLFLLVPLKLALPIPITMPREALGWWPGAVAVRDWAGTEASPSDPPLVDHPAELPPVEPVRAEGPSGTPTGDPPSGAGPSSVPAAAMSRVEAPETELTLSARLMFGWIAIVAVSLSGLVWRHARMARRVRRSRALDPASLPVDLPRLYLLSGLRHPVALVSAPWANSPAVWGLFRPCLLLPPGLAEGLSPDALRWVLLHELAHVRRRDGWVALFQRLVQIAYFFHPAVWLANRMIDVQREYACDDAALAAAGASRRACGDGFLTIVERANASPAPRVPALGLLHSPLLIRRRLMRILDARRPLHARLTVGAGALLALAGILVLPRVQARPGTPPAPEPQQAARVEAKPAAGARRTIPIRVMEKEGGKPLPGATVEVLRSDPLGNEVKRLAADAEGRCEITVPAEAPEWFSVAAHSDGFVPLEVSWKAADFVSGPPAGHTFALTRGEVIGGVVRDEQGRPIAGAKVIVWVRSPTARGKEKEQVDTTRFPVVTDAEGRWRAAYLPRGTAPDAQLMVRLEHPDFASELVGFSRRLTAAEARTLEHAEVMTAGVALKGRVIGPNGEPVKDARVALDEAANADPGDTTFRATTDAAGRFRFAHIKHQKDRRGGHQERVSVQAPGLAPEVRLVEIGPDMPPVEVRLKAARPLRGRVVDAAGRPLAGAVVSLGSYQQSRTLDWRAESDAAGRFTWPDGPAEGTVELQAYRAPYLRAVQRRVSAGAEAAEIVLHRPFRARGTVVDAQTGKPVARFKLTPGTGPLPPDDRYQWDRSEVRQGGDGAFDENDLFSYDQPLGKALLVEAEGYLPQIFDGFTTAAESAEHAFRLRRAESTTGIVRDPDGRPLAGARVELSFSARDFDFGNRQDWPPPSDEFSVTTDAEGRYSMRPREKPFGLVVRHERGFARLWPSEVARSADISLRPWSRIEGVYRVGDRSAADQEVTISLDATSPASTDWVHYSYRARTDAEGRFVVERVLPGFAVAFTPTVGPFSFEVRPGQTARVTLGGSGRSVVGRVAAPGETALPFPLEKGAFARLVLDQPEPTRPGTFAAMGPAERAAYFGRWYQTPEGRAWKLGYQGNPIRVSADGSFRAVDVPPGKYKLEIRVSDPEVSRRRDEKRTEVSASVERKVVVPEGPAGEPIDLDTLELILKTQHYDVLAVGDKVPEIDGATTLDGKPLHLSDYRGKYVLLDFWATWCGPCLQEEPHLKAAHQATKDDRRVVMLSLSLDERVEAPAMHARAKGLGWVQGFLGNPGAGVPARFGVSSIPQTLLIGPDGTVVARDLRGTRIGAAIAEALKKP